MKPHLRILIFLLFAGIFFTACDRFFPDPLDPRLPVYSETGKCQVGAVINGIVYIDYKRFTFFGSSYGNSRILMYGRDSLEISFSIQSENQGLHFLDFKLKDISADNWREMEFGNGKKFSIDGQKLKVSMPRVIDTEQDRVELVEGNLTVKHIPGTKIMAGTFGFTLRTSAQKTYNVHYGRYDFFYDIISQ